MSDIEVNFQTNGEEIGELFEQKKRVEKGWFPMNPKRTDEYKKR